MLFAAGVARSFRRDRFICPDGYLACLAIRILHRHFGRRHAFRLVDRLITCPPCLSPRLQIARVADAARSPARHGISGCASPAISVLALNYDEVSQVGSISRATNRKKTHTTCLRFA
ncbi:hypothetical protein PUN28_014477 [Cardiocondyla obscurior]|uniref:Uncharacterized protein n=1 Tax=Cardiocondyla obscurior TaxID=286306 RepID=A0AAW2F1M0_9HYME